MQLPRRQSDVTSTCHPEAHLSCVIALSPSLHALVRLSKYYHNSHWQWTQLLFFGKVTVYLLSVITYSLHVILCNTLNTKKDCVQIYQIHFSITILPWFFSLFILTSFSHSSTPPDAFLATGFHTTLQVLFPLSTPTQKHSHIDFPLCCSHYTSLTSRYISSWISLSLSFSQCHRQSHPRSPSSPIFATRIVSLPRSHFPNLATNWVSPAIKSITTFILEFNVP